MKRITSFIVLSFVASILLSSTFVSSSGAAQQIVSKQFGKYFLSTQWVAKQKKILLIDARSADAYNAGHIPGAINVPPSTFFFTRTEGNPGASILFTIPTPTEFIKLVNSWGIKPKTIVVTYGDDDVNDFGYAARLAWTLKLYGHEKVYTMDGGFPKWQNEYSQKVTTAATEPTPNTESYVITGYSDILATKYDVLSVVNGTVTDSVIFDTRTPGEYDGTGGAIAGDPRTGHIPGAIFFNWANVFVDNDQGIKVLKSEAELKTLFEGLGITKDKTIIPYCEGGFRSAHVTQLLLGLGYPSVRHFVNSWSEWSRQDPDVYLANTGTTP